MGLRIKEGMRLVYCGSSEHMKVVKGKVVYGALVSQLELRSDCGTRYNLPSNTGVWEEEKVTAPPEKAGDSPKPVKEEYIIVSAANHKGQGKSFQSYEEAETNAAKITHNVLICKVVAKSTTKTVVEKV